MKTTYRRPLSRRLIEDYGTDILDLLGGVLAIGVFGVCIIVFMAALGNHGAVEAVRLALQ